MRKTTILILLILASWSAGAQDVDVKTVDRLITKVGLTVSAQEATADGFTIKGILISYKDPTFYSTKVSGEILLIQPDHIEFIKVLKQVHEMNTASGERIFIEETDYSIEKTGNKIVLYDRSNRQTPKLSKSLVNQIIEFMEKHK